MTDIHCHILPGVDDGAKDIEEALLLLRMELENGVDTVVLTPHFRSGTSNLDKFLSKRQEAYEKLMKVAEHMPLRLLTGAEVAFSADLLTHDISPLCLGGKKCILIELPTSNFPHLAPDVFYKLSLNGFTPVIAHIERYPYIIRNTGILDDMVLGGAYIQINADSLLRSRKLRKILLNLIVNQKIHIIASDAHSQRDRPPNLAKAMALVERKLGVATSDKLKRNAVMLLE